MENHRKKSSIREVDSETRLDYIAPPRFDEGIDKSRTGHWELLWRNRQWLGRAMLYALILGTVVAFLIPPKFESTVRIMPPEALDSGTTMMAAVMGKSNPALAAMAGSILGIKSTGALFSDLLKSRTVQDHIVEHFQLQKVYWDKFEEDARKTLEHRTSIEEDRKSGVISISVSDRTPQRAHDIAQAYIVELNGLFAQVSTSSARRERIFIEQRLANVKVDLEDAERQFGAYASKNATLDIKEQTRAMVESTAQLQGQLIAAQSELQSLEQIYTANNVRVRATQAKVAELQRQLMKVAGTADSSADNSGNSEEPYPSIRKLPILGVEWADLYRRVKIQETVFELLHQQYELARIQEAKEIGTVNVIDPPNIPEKKSFPPRLLIIAMCLVLSMAGAIAWVIYADKWQRMSPDDPRKSLAIEVGETVAMRFGQIRDGLSRLRDRQDNGRRSPGGQKG